MNAKIAVPMHWNIPAIVKRAGGSDHSYDVDLGILKVVGTTQAKLDDAVAAFDPVADARQKAHIAIDAAAGDARARYITIAPGQEATYLIKGQQARDFQAGGYTGEVPAMVQAEAEATGESAQAACARIVAEEAAWLAKAAMIESARRRGKLSVLASADEASVDIARNAALTELAAL